MKAWGGKNVFKCLGIYVFKVPVGKFVRVRPLP